MSDPIPFIKPKEPIPNCSFCNITKTAAFKFFSSGMGQHICDQCVTHAKKRLEEEA